MKKLVPYVLVFVLGFAMCAYILQWMGYTTVSTGGKAAVIEALGKQPVRSVPRKGGDAIADAVERVGPAVVNIDTVTERHLSSPLQQFLVPFAPRWEIRGAGSGVIISKDGYVLTNSHVVEGADRITVRLADGSELKGRVVGADRWVDLAVLKVRASNIPAAELGDSDAIRVGDWAIAIGNPLGLGNTVTVGVISATKRTNLEISRDRTLKEAIQTDAAINRGNSGGALANAAGQVIGINTAIYSTEAGGGNIGIGFAIPINSAKGIVKKLIAEGKIARPWLGVLLDDVVGYSALRYEQAGYKSRKGAIVAVVVSDSPAAKAGIKKWDIITHVDRKAVSNSSQLISIIKNRKIGDRARFSIWRMGKSLTVVVKLAESPPPAR